MTNILSTVNVCNGKKTEYCNPNWVPFANMDQGLLGYDTVVADPFAKDGDPGYRAKIFNAVSADRAGRMSMDAGITATDMVECQSSESSTAVSNFRQYANEASFSGSLSANVDVNIMGFGGSVGFRLNHESESARNFFASGESVMLITQATCLLHKVNLNQMALPQFTSTFIATLKKMELATNPTLQKLLFKQFYQTYGTHYITEARFGAKLVVQTKFSKSTMNSQSMEKKKTCGGLSLGFSVGGGSASVDTDMCKESSSDTSQGNSNEQSTSTVLSIGSKPMKDGMTWANQEFDQPQVISLDKAPLTTLISKRHLEKYSVDATKINSWFVPMMKNFCENMNKELSEKEKITCTHKTGCGIDDNCTLDEVCKTTLDGSYVCQLSPAAKVGKAALMFTIKGETSSAKMTVEDVVNTGLTCQTVPALPADAKTQNGQIFAVKGSSSPKLITGNKLYEWKPKATAWYITQAAREPIFGEYDFFDVGKLGVWGIPFDWGKESTSRLLSKRISWKGPMHPFTDKVWSGFSVAQVDSTGFYFSGGKIADKLADFDDPKVVIEPIRDVYTFNMTNGVWTKLSLLSEPLSQHASGIVASKANGKELIFTSGLDKDDKINQKTHLYNLKTKLWRVGPAFPKTDTLAFDKPTMTAYHNTVMVFGGRSSLYRGNQHVIQYNAELTMWSIRPNTVSDVTGQLLATSYADLTCKATARR